MKKKLSVLLAVLLSVCMLAPSFAVLAQENENQVKQQINGACEYLYSDKVFTAEDAIDFLNLVRSGYDVSLLTDDFTKDVEAKLIANNGKLYYPVAEYDESWNFIGMKDTEELELYAAIIEIYDLLLLDYTDIGGYNLADIMTSCGLTACAENNYYYYRLITEACAVIDAPESFIDDVMNNIVSLYNMGEGTTFWGSIDASADDLSAFITALAPYKDDYQDYIVDALACLESFNTPDGYTNFGTANADSTAFALMAYSAIKDKEKADEVYQLLCKFESDKTGVFTYDGVENSYATKDALIALGYYNQLLEQYSCEDSEVSNEKDEIFVYEETSQVISSSSKDVQSEEESTAQSTTATSKNTSKTSPKTGVQSQVALFSALAGAMIITAVAKKKIK